MRFAAAAGPVLEQAPAPVAHPGIDEHRRARTDIARESALRTISPR